ncbi:S1 family peptidase [Fortiea contorta]|uniref:S1 family peptidase n=1 Tax=Fortiea contorta TaxID=1892405 RepID=UPI0003451CB4|nr:serine protease [Fortiea contorta]
MKNRTLVFLIVCLSSIFLSVSVKALPITSPQIYQQAQAITVKVLSGDTSGSGTLIQRQGRTYTVITNQHVLTPGQGSRYRIQTPDGRIYPATVSPSKNQIYRQDLGLLQFFSRQKTYSVALLNTSANIEAEATVFAAGFPINSSGLVLTTGRISLLLDKPLNDGYQIGYTNQIHKGMSGGALLNLHGEVIGINGRHAYPLWNNPDIFADGSTPSTNLQQQINQLSWAIPMQSFLKLITQFAL